MPRACAPSWKNANPISPAARGTADGRRHARTGAATHLGRARPRGARHGGDRGDGQLAQHLPRRIHLSAGRHRLWLRVQFTQSAHGVAALQHQLSQGGAARRPAHRACGRAPARRARRHLRRGGQARGRLGDRGIPRPCPLHRRHHCPGRRRMSVPDKPTLRVGLAGLGAVGLEVAKRLIAGVPGLTLAAVAVRDANKARRALPQLGATAIKPFTALAEDCDVVVECLPPALFRDIAISAIDKGRIFMPLSVAQLLENWDLVERAKQKGARILPPTGALIGLDAVRAAAEGTIHSIKMITRKPPAGVEGAPELLEHNISVAGLTQPLKVFDGTAREGARGFPANVNVAAALSLAGIGPDRTQLEIWADPALTRNTHRIEVDADTARFSMTIEGVPSENPRTGRIVPLSTVAALRALVAELKVGT